MMRGRERETRGEEEGFNSSQCKSKTPTSCIYNIRLLTTVPILLVLGKRMETYVSLFK